MKKLIIALFISFTSMLSFAQSEWCATDQMLEQSFQNDPAMKAAFFNEQAQLMNHPGLKGLQNDKAPTIIVPVVVHVIHDNGSGNILKALIEDGLRIINEDFQKLNADTTGIRTVFQSTAADSQIEFRLAKIDPNGNCTEGIVRVNNSLTNTASNSVKALSC